jgi:octaprenyl-diphosphate synthase
VALGRSRSATPGRAMSQLLQSPLSQVADRLPAADGLIAYDLQEVERILAQSLTSGRKCVNELVGHVRSYRGKRLRPTLLLVTARACGRVTPAHHVLGAVVEMIHTATLVHDDVLDSASVRRHVSTVNAAWGNQTSILLGDYLFTKAFHLASSLDNVLACRIIGEATNRVCEGELQQGVERGNLDLSEEEYLDVIDGKTAALTACCCRLGALYSGATETVVQSLTRFGRHLGLAFQIADDLLDLVGDEKKTGKSLGTDAEQQKLTLPLIRLLQQSSTETASQARHILRTSGNHKREALVPFFEETDALGYASARAEDSAARARSELSCLAPSIYRGMLEALTRSAVERKS